MECYFGIPCGGFVLHTLNIRLHPTDLAYIASHAGDRVVVVDEMLVPLLDQFVGETPDRARLRGRVELRGAARGRVGRRLARPGAGRERGGGDVLHERHHRPAEGRRLLAPLDGAAHVRRLVRRAARPVARRVGHVPSGRADVPRKRLGLPVPGRDAGLEDRLPGAAHGSAQPARGVRAGEGDVGCGGADDLDGHPQRARRGARPIRPLAHERDARRRLGRPARDDRRLQAAARPRHLPRLGHDRDVAGRVGHRPPGRPAATPTTRRSSTTSRSRASRCRSSRCAPATSTGS